MAIRSGEAEWKGDLKTGTGTLRSQTGAVEGKYSFGSRFEEGTGTNPEELIASAHAACFSMAFSAQLAGAGFPPDSVRTTAKVHLEKTDAGQTITRIALTTRAKVPGIDAAVFNEKAEAAKTGCPISRALAAIPEITLDAQLES
jgi:lipoyl-dependent peroxiredoxin